MSVFCNKTYMNQNDIQKEIEAATKKIEERWDREFTYGTWMTKERKDQISNDVKNKIKDDLKYLIFTELLNDSSFVGLIIKKINDLQIRGGK